LPPHVASGESFKATQEEAAAAALAVLEILVAALEEDPDAARVNVTKVDTEELWLQVPEPGWHPVPQ
jgi:hypothetical protein